MRNNLLKLLLKSSEKMYCVEWYRVNDILEETTFFNFFGLGEDGDTKALSVTIHQLATCASRDVLPQYSRLPSRSRSSVVSLFLQHPFLKVTYWSNVTWLCHTVLYAPWSSVYSASRHTSCSHGKPAYDVTGSHRHVGMTHSRPIHS